MKTSTFTSSALASLAGCARAQSYQPPTFFDTTWAGPVLLADGFNQTVNGSGFSQVEATLVMPTLAIPSKPHNESAEAVDEYTAAFWVGLDGFVVSGTSGDVRGLWQAGVVMSIWENGTTAYTGFYEWVPNDPISITQCQLAISEGDHIHVVVNTTQSGYSGSTTLTNLNTSQVFSVSQDAPVTWRGPTWPAPGSSAEWIMEAGTYLNGPQYVLPNWGNATILGAQACYADGECLLAGDGAPADTQVTAVLWNDTETLYTRSHVAGDQILIEYVEQSFSE